MSDIAVTFQTQSIAVAMTGGSNWNSISSKPAVYPANPFQTPVFANPLALNGTLHKDFKVTVTGDTTVNLTGTSDGDSGVIELIIDAVGGYTISLGTMFTKKIGTNSINALANKDNFVFWFMAGTDIVYTINTV